MEKKDALIHIEKKDCQMCYACVRGCPVKAIIVKPGKSYPEIVDNRCIGCGSCLAACTPNAIRYHDSKPEVTALVESGEKIVAVCDPSIASEFDDVTDYRKFVEMIKALGIHHVMEASFGVDLVAKAYKQLIDNFKGKHYIFANCPAVVFYIEKFHPGLIDNLAPIVSPMIASAKVARQMYGDNTRVVYIGPCIATKKEAARHEGTGKVDAVLTYTELRGLFATKQVDEKTLEFSDFDPPHGAEGSLYPISNGIIEAAGLDEHLLTGNVYTAEGKQNMMDAVEEFEHYLPSIKRHFNLFYNEGCIMGPGTSKKGKKYIRKHLVTRYTNRRLAKINRARWEEDLLKFDVLDLSAEFTADDQRLPMPSREKIKEILKIIGRKSEEDEVSCQSCGYDSCRDFAVAVGKGLAKTDMCVTYNLRNRQEYIKTLKATNEKLSNTQEALKESEKKARKEKEAANEASEIMHLMLQKLRAGVVVMNKDLKIIQSNKRFIAILGEEAESIDEVIPGLVGADIKSLLPYNIYNLFNYVLQNNENVMSRDVHFEDKFLNISIFTIKKNKIVGAIVRDMFLPEVQKEEVIRRVTEVIDKNLEMVQQIGFLLGEGASETEHMLNSIIEFHKTSRKGEKEG
jgi:Na+-translocating ferredoxin:NAD+ oxidoreductase RNF subunit RnfB